MKRTRPRGFAPWRPRKKTMVLLDQVNQVLQDYREYLPLTIRQVFYRLVGTVGYLKSETAYKNLCETLNRARRAGLISFRHLRDDGVERYASPSWTDAESFLAEMREAADDFRLDRQAGQAKRLWLLCEAAGMAPMLSRVADEHGVPVLSSGGFDSLTAKYDLACELAQHQSIVLHVGDHDPSGVHLFDSLAEDVAALTVGMDGVEPEFVRVAVTPDQARDLDLPSAPPKATDNRRFEGEETWQAEAIPPDVLARIVQEAIVSRLDVQTRAEVLLQEIEDSERLRKTLDWMS